MSAMFVVNADRQLSFSPTWQGECLAFDRPTTDLFVLPDFAREVLATLAAAGPLDANDLSERLGGGEENRAAIDRLLLEFEACGLIEALNVDCCGPD